MMPIGKTLARLTQMGWDEQRTRLAQEVSKRVDLILYRAGLLSQRNGAGMPVAAPWQFFFTQADLPNLISGLKEKTGPRAESIIREANEICQHRFRLLGYEGLDYGPEIDWHLDVVHGKRAPLKPWFKIDFLSSDEVGDHKIIWELNRHQQLVLLAKAWLLTRDERYLIELKSQWYSWQLANPYPLGINWASSLEVAFRSMSWIWVLSQLAGSDGFDASFRLDVIRALAANGRHIEKYLSTYFSPNTHLLGEALALFFTGAMCPEIAAAGRWRESGWQTLLTEAERQVRSDGVYFEQSLYYHVYALDFFLHARVLAGRNGMDIPPAFDAVLNRMLDFLSALSQAGPVEGFGDDDGGRVFNPRRNRTEHMTDPLALGAILFQREDLRASASLTEEAVWLFGIDAISFFEKSPTPKRKIESTSFKNAGIYVMASDSALPQRMVIDAGPQGIGRSGHGHADALSVSVAVDGRRYLVDSGAFCYVCGERESFRGTRAHNTLQVDGLDQAVPEGPFAWSSIPEVSREQWITGDSFALFAGSHTGYMRLADPVLHRRFIFYLHSQFWLIRDVFEGEGLHDLEIRWHFASDLSVRKAENAFVAAPNGATPGECRESRRLALLTVAEPQWKATIGPDFVSPAYGKQDPAISLALRTHAQLPAEHAILLMALNGRDRIGRFSRAGTEEIVQSASALAYRYEEFGKMHYMLFGNSKAKVWKWERWTSDASFLYFAVENGRIEKFILCEGSVVESDGKAVLAHPIRIERLEWNRSAAGHISSSDSTALRSFSWNVLDDYASEV